MSFNKHNDKNHRAFNIKLTTSNGNTVGYINLNPQFVKVATKKQVENCTVVDIEEIGPDGFIEYLKKLVIVIEEATPDETISLEDF